MSFFGAGGDTSEIRPCQYGMSKLLVRGPKRTLGQPYAAFLGGSETYGQFVHHPFAAQVERDTGLRCINLGAVNAGLDAFALDDAVLGIAAKAEFVVIQLLAAQNLSNRFYRVHPRRNDRFLEPSPLLRSMYGDVDFTAFHFNRHLLAVLKSVSRHRYAVIEAELKQVWIARMKLLIDQMQGQVLLLWLGYPQDPANGLGPDPLLVTDEMILALKRPKAKVVKMRVDRAGVRGDMDTDAIGALQPPAAAHVIGARTHMDIAKRLGPLVAYRH